MRSEYRLIARDGRTVWIRDESTAICDEDGVPRQWQGYLLDITAEREALATARAARVLGSAHRPAEPRAAGAGDARGTQAGEVLTLLYLDLDDFKTVNDSLGHGAGDELLYVVAKRLKDLVRENDLVARIGGDEFALLVGDCDAAAVAQRVVTTLDDPVHASGYELAVSASIGIATGSSPREILRQADMAMYDAKGAGGGTYRFFEQAMHDAAVNRLELLADLSRPSFANELFLEYQPLFEIASGRLVGAEALARWRHPRRGLIQPLDFIPLAEETGRIVDLGRLVLAEAARQAVEWSHDSRPRRADQRQRRRTAACESQFRAGRRVDPRVGGARPDRARARAHRVRADDRRRRVDAQPAHAARSRHLRRRSTTSAPATPRSRTSPGSRSTASRSRVPSSTSATRARKGRGWSRRSPRSDMRSG